MKLLYKNITLLLTALVVSISAHGAPLSPDEALGRVRVNTQGLQRMSTSAMKLVYTGQETAHPAYYVFSAPEQANGGYVIASADDLAVPVLGYVEDGVFDYATLPPQLQWWLGEYASQIEWVRGQRVPAPGMVVGAGRPYREPIASMVHARWDQSAPYNDLCPVYSTGKTVTGCVATAMAQILRFWEYPAKGTGSHSYTYNGITNSFDFGNTTFQWKEMPFILTDNWTTANNVAVSTLMRACGVAVDMQYNVSSEGGSGAYSEDVAPALIQYFSYAPSTKHRHRGGYGLYEWEDLIYSSLEHGCPVYYHGQGSNGGHAFVVDGYGDNGYFHLNWGWSGSSNGYFLLTALDPATLGIGGGGGGFNWSQGAIIDLRPNFTGSTEEPYIYSSVDYTLSLSSKTVTYNGGAYNYGNSAINGVRYGFTFTNAAGKDWNAFYGFSYNLNKLYGLKSYSATIPADLPAGEYYVNPCFSIPDPAGGSNRIVYEMAASPRLKNKYILEIGTGGTAELFEFTEQEIEVPSFKVTTPLYSGSHFGINAQLHNPAGTEIYKQVFIGWFSGSSNSFNGVGDAIMIDIPRGETHTMDMAIEVPSRVKSTPTSTYIMSPGSFKIALMVNNGTTSNPVYERISDMVPVTINSAQSSVGLASSNFTISNAGSVHASDIHISTTLRGTGGYYSEPIYVFILDGSSQKAMHLTPVQFINSGESKTLDFSFPFDAGEKDHQYRILLNYRSGNSLKYLDNAYFTVGTTGVDVISGADTGVTVAVDGNSAIAVAPSSVTGVELYTLQGLRQTVAVEVTDNIATINLQGISRGIYLIRIHTSEGTHVVRLMRP